MTYELDSADLALLEIDLQNLDPLSRGVAQMLLDIVRNQRERVAAAERERDEARGHAGDAMAHLNRLRNYLTDAPLEADQAADAVERVLQAIEDP